MTGHKFAYLFIFILIITTNKEATSQEWGGEKKNSIWRGVSINTNVGALSYFGDVSKFDKKPINKLKYESGPAFSIFVTKNFQNKFGISAQLLHGKFNGGFRNYTFKTQLLEFNLNIRTELLSIILHNKKFNIGISPYMGFGQFYFKTLTTKYNNEALVSNSYNTGIPEFVFFIGGELSYKLPKNIALTGDFSVRQCQSDKLDNYIQDKSFDFYSYLSMGISYRISNIALEPMKNKARLAHNEPYHSKRKYQKACRRV
ncbi:MAG: hypothetical protein R2750_04755 [Bacteroidales bacterium]